MNQRRKVYCPPVTKQINRYAKDVCQELAQQENAAYGDPEVVSGLADYLNFSAQLIAKYLNEGHHELLDKNDKQS